MRRRPVLTSVLVLVAVAVALPAAVVAKRARDRAAFACVETAKEGHLDVQVLTIAGRLIGAREINWTPFGANGPQAGSLRVVMKRDDALAQATAISRAVVHPTRQLVERNEAATVAAVVVNVTCDGEAKSITLPFQRGPAHLMDCGRRHDTTDCVQVWFQDVLGGAGVGFDSVLASFMAPCPARDCIDSEPVR